MAPMKALLSPRPVASPRAPLAATALLLPLLLALAGCGDVEGTNTESATCTLVPSGSFSVEQDPPALPVTLTTTNIVNGSTNTTTTVSEAPAISLFTLSSSPAGDASWSFQASDDAGGSYAGTASGPLLSEPGDGNAYAPGSTIATFSLQSPAFAGTLSAVATASIPLDVVRTSTTNGDSVVVGRHGQHSLTPQNTSYRLSLTLLNTPEPSTLDGSAPAPAATIAW